MTATSADEVAAVEPVIRRVVAARALNPSDVDDLVQDCLERLLAARGRLAPEAVLPYAVVTARNLVSTHAASTARRARTVPRILDPAEPQRPEEMVLAGETRRAMTAALSQLSPAERSDVLRYYAEPLAGAPAVPARGALRVRMARTRAKLRLEYLLAYRHVELPTPVCRRVLLAISAGDTRRQRDLNASQHLLDCEICDALSEPLDRRSIGLTAITLPGGLLAWAAAKAKAQPVHAAASVATGSAVVAGAVVIPHLLAAPPPHRRPPPAPAPVISQLSVGDHPVPDARANGSLRPLIGERARASGVRVESVVTRNGFWIGSDRGRIWVQLVGPLRPLHIHPGDHLQFTGTVVGDPASFPARAGLGGASGRLLGRQGAHLAVRTTAIAVRPPG